MPSSIWRVSSAALALFADQTISCGETKNGVLAADDCIDHNANGFDYYYNYYEFTGTAGQQISIASTSTAIDPDLLLIFPDDSRLYKDNSGGSKNARIPGNGFLTAGQSGRYYIVDSSGVPVQVGAYALTLTLNAPSPPPTPPSTKQTVEFYNVTLNHHFVTVRSKSSRNAAIHRMPVAIRRTRGRSNSASRPGRSTLRTRPMRRKTKSSSATRA